MKSLHFSGSAEDIGIQHGIQAKEEVLYSLDSYEKLFWHEGKINWKEAIELAKSHERYIEKTNVGLLEEMNGIAKGASVDFYDILTLNARSEIALTANKADGCTSVAVMPPIATATYLGQTWDWREAQSRSLILTKIEQKNSPVIHMVTEGGIIGKIGLNTNGLGVCLNALRANLRTNKLPVHVGLREILNSETMEEVYQKIGDDTIASSANFLIAQGKNKEEEALAINKEISPEGIAEKTTADAYLYHTNHFCSESLIEHIGKESIEDSLNSFTRKDRIEELINASVSQKKHITRDVLKTWFADHKHYPESICRHRENESSAYTNTVTAFSVIMNLEECNMLLMEGQACCPVEEKKVGFS
ncbi:C45 family peptidase [Virgibacillus halodenitrificans]|uniref:C45 family peptidase n=1 Tax=Virgibacillus halodenitrificans TaxID=1482 RepID=UPI002DBBD457|nr:C45 family peptidase [Virgibacillus halodenitrificans]MEC2159582.1 C45 family autoproteolytic acyltransferase/hydrolase [Virgibacillus halodenitrificans]